MVGERYILGGQNFTLKRLFAELSQIAEVPPPTVRVPGQLAAGAVAALERVGIPVPAATDEVKAGSLWWTYSNEKARRELGFEPRPHEETLADTIDWQYEHLGEAAVPASARPTRRCGPARPSPAPPRGSRASIPFWRES